VTRAHHVIGSAPLPRGPHAPAIADVTRQLTTRRHSLSLSLSLSVPLSPALTRSHPLARRPNTFARARAIGFRAPPRPPTRRRRRAMVRSRNRIVLSVLLPRAFPSLAAAPRQTSDSVPPSLPCREGRGRPFRALSAPINTSSAVFVGASFRVSPTPLLDVAAFTPSHREWKSPSGGWRTDVSVVCY
jgi:hypothetical protein